MDNLLTETNPSISRHEADLDQLFFKIQDDDMRFTELTNHFALLSLSTVADQGGEQEQQIRGGDPQREGGEAAGGGAEEGAPPGLQGPGQALRGRQGIDIYHIFFFLSVSAFFTEHVKVTVLIISSSDKLFVNKIMFNVIVAND